MAALIIVNVAYVIYVSSSLFTDMFRLRVILIVSSVAFIAFGAADGNLSIVLWNIVFGGAHLIQLWRYITQRRAITLSVEHDDIRKEVFPDLDQFDFYSLWSMGDDRRFVNQDVTQQGSPVEDFMVIVSGRADVYRDGNAVNVLGPQQLIGEISYVSGKTASARVHARGELWVRSWSHERLAAFETINPTVHSALRNAIGRDLATKIAD